MQSGGPSAFHTRPVNYLYSCKCEWRPFTPAINDSVVAPAATVVSAAKADLYDRTFTGAAAHDVSLVLLIGRRTRKWNELRGVGAR